MAGDRRHGARTVVESVPATGCREPVTVDAVRHVQADGRTAAAFVPARSGSACTAGSPTSRPAAADFAKLATLGPGGPLLGDVADLRVDRALPAGACRRRRSTPKAPQAAHLRRQPPGRLPPGRPLQRLRPGHPAARRAVPGGRRRAATDGSAPRGPRRARSPRRWACSRRDYAAQSDLRAVAGAGAAEALRDVDRVTGSTCDLERGWRVTMPNLEQTGLLEIDYADLDWVAERRRSLGRPRTPRCATPTPAHAGGDLHGAARRDAPRPRDRRRSTSATTSTSSERPARSG